MRRWGLEWRRETYTMFTGGRQSWQAGPWVNVSQLIDPATGLNYPSPGTAANGLAGTDPDAAGSFKSENFAGYVDVEYTPMDAFLVQGALADTILNIAACAMAHREIHELEANPVFAYSDRAVVVDARAFLPDWTAKHTG